MDEARAKIIDLDLNEILPNRFQPRIKFNEDSIIELSESIKEHGVIQPVVVRPIGDKYEIIAGERRYKASVLAGKDTIPAIITNLDDKNSAEVALIENVQRRDLTPIEEAISYKKILDMGYLTQEQLAVKLGKSQSTIANKVRLLQLCDEGQEALMSDKISERHARSLLRLDSFEMQKQLINRIVEERLTVRKTDEEIDKMNNAVNPPVESPKVETEYNASPLNPGFIDVDKISQNAQEINQPKIEVNFGALLSSEAPQPVPLEPVAPIVPPVHTQESVVPIPVPVIPEPVSVPGVIPEVVVAPEPIVALEPAVSVPELAPVQPVLESVPVQLMPETPIMENIPEAPTVETETVFGLNTVDPFADRGVTSSVGEDVPLVDSIPDFEMPSIESIQIEDVNPEVADEPEVVVAPEEVPVPVEMPAMRVPEPLVEIPPVAVVEVEPVPTVPVEIGSQEEDKKFSFADLLAPQTTETEPIPAPITETVIPVPTVDNIPVAVEPLPAIESFPGMPSTEPIDLPVPVIASTTPIVEDALPGRFFTADEPEESEEPGGGEKVIPVPLEGAEVEVDVQTGGSMEHIPEEVRPIIITDYSKQYDPVIPNAPVPVERVDFRKIINMIRDMSNVIESAGYTIDTEEYDLEDSYQVTFKIDKK